MAKGQQGYQWEWAKFIEKEHLFRGSLILGNGSSQAISPNFTYANLFEQAIENEHILEDVQKLFSEFDTKDFELILKYLNDARIVNKALDFNNDCERLDKAYNNVRTALIKIVRDIHVTYQEALPHFETIGLFLRRFQNIVSLNYDLVLYWIIMKENNKNHNNPLFKDGCKANSIHDDLLRLYEPYNGEKSSCLAVYPHGSLFLSTGNHGESKIKLKSNSTMDLLEHILDYWENGTRPLFVSDGDSKKKKAAIKRSNYLSAVYYDILPNLTKPPKHDKSLLIYGWSMAKQDDHIFEQIRKNKDLETVGVSIYAQGKSEDTKDGEADKIYKKLKDHFPEIQKIYFFDSTCAGLWNNEINRLTAKR
ncbi:MAG: DUF4917 family protein [Candidatus Melainabacteria bacterium]|nr:DUF4917 family protein [Candidatus Melainabacteria bacterium]